MLGEPRVASGNETAAGNFVGEKCPQLSAEIFGCGRKGGGRKGKASHASIVAETTMYGPGGSSIRSGPDGDRLVWIATS